MTLDQRDKKTLSDLRMAKAHDFLQDAKANLQQERYRTAVNRAYYAALSAVRALLILEGANPETHEGVITMLSLRFIKTGLLPVEGVKNFKVLLSRRTDVDYGDFDSIDLAEADDSIKIADALLDQVEQARQGLLTGM